MEEQDPSHSFPWCCFHYFVLAMYFCVSLFLSLFLCVVLVVLVVLLALALALALACYILISSFVLGRNTLFVGLVPQLFIPTCQRTKTAGAKANVHKPCKCDLSARFVATLLRFFMFSPMSECFEVDLGII